MKLTGEGLSKRPSVPWLWLFSHDPMHPDLAPLETGEEPAPLLLMQHPVTLGGTHLCVLLVL